MKYILLLTVLMLIGCAGNVYKNFGYSKEDKGTLIVKFPANIQKVNITVNGILAVADAHTSYIQIENIPIGEHTIRIVAASGGRMSPINVTKKILIEKNVSKTILIDVAPYSTGYWVYVGILIGLILLPSILMN